MDTLTFISELTKALAWPVSFVIISALFRKQVIMLLSRLRKGKVGAAEFEFEEAMKHLEESASELASSSDSSVGVPSVRLVTTNPRAAILESWLGLEDKAIDLAIRLDLIKPTARRNADGAIRSIRKAGILSRSNLNILEELQDLRNQAAHDPDFNPLPDAVMTYSQLARDLGAELERM